MQATPKALFISHGGGPLPLLGDPAHRDLVSRLQQISADMPRPEAIIVISAHWEAEVPTITAGSQPELIYDYYGFPAESYEITYPCPGEPALAREIAQATQTHPTPLVLDESRGFDHGVFVPLKIMYPEADIPVVQVSLMANLDASRHIELGRALSQVKREKVLVLGSGFSFHNLQAFFRPPDSQHREQNTAFEAWLDSTCTNPALPEADRCEQLIHWAQAAGARYCHPREEHLLPLHVCYGVAQSASRQRWELEVMNAKCSMYAW